MIRNNFDGSGFVAGMQSHKNLIKGQSVALFGVGAAGCSLAFAVAGAGAKKITIFNRTVERAKSLVLKLQMEYPGRDIKYSCISNENLGSFDIMVNATSLGLNKKDSLPFDPEETSHQCLIADINMDPEKTPLLEKALSLGRKVQFGGPMVEHQAPMFSKFLKLW